MQLAVLALVAGHFAFDVVGPDQTSMIPAGIPVALLLVPVSYAALLYGLAGSVATAGWATALWLPDLLLPDDRGHAGNDLIELALVIAVAVFVGRHIDNERRQAAMARRAQIQYAAAESKYRQLFNTNSAPILLLDQAGVVVESNDAARQLAPGGLTGRRVDGILDIDPATLEDGTSPRLLTITSRLGGTRDYRPSVTRVHSPGSAAPVTQLVLGDVTEERASGERARRFAARLLEVQEQEQRRIAQELHDEPLQLLVHLARALDDAATASGEGGDLAEVLADARRQALQIAARVRAVVRGLRPPALDKLGLVPALRGLLASVEQTAGVGTDLKVEGSPPKLPPEMELGVFRIAQEAIGNAVAHGAPSRVQVYIGGSAGGMQLRVADDGRGFDTAAWDRAAASDRFGLLGMRERADLMGGRLDIVSGPGLGTVVELHLVVPGVTGVPAGTAVA